MNLNITISNKKYYNNFLFSISILITLILWSSSLGLIFYQSDEEVSSKFILGFVIIFGVYLIFSLKWIENVLSEKRVLNRYGFNLFSLFVFFIVFQILQGIIIGNSFTLFVTFRYILFFSIIVISIIIGFKVPDKALVYFEKIGIIWTLVFVILYSISFINNPTIGLFREFRDSILFHNAIEDGGFFSIFFPLFLYSKVNRNTKYIIIFMFLFYLIVKNGTQASILAIFVTLTIYMSYKLKKRKKTLHALFIITTISFLIAFFSNVLYKYDSGLSWRGVKQASERYYSGSIGVRMGNIWIPMALHVIDKSPIVGFGNGNWRIQSKKLGFDYLHDDGTVSYVYQRSPHNIFLVYFVDWGILGLILMIYIFYNAIKSNYKIMINSKINSEIKRYAEAFFCGWISFLFWGFTGNAHGWLGWEIICFLLIGTVILKYYSVNAVYNVNI